MSKTIFSNATILSDTFDTTLPANLCIENGRITDISSSKSSFSGVAETIVDCEQMLLIPSFTDTHLHLPGSFLYQRHGVNLMPCENLDACKDVLLAYKPEHAILRGFGWSQRLFQETPGAAESFYNFLNQSFPSLPVILFSDDYHSCICNETLLQMAAEHLPKKNLRTNTGLLTERDLFSLLHHISALSFTNEEIEDSLLAYQSMLLSKGITAIQTLMPLGLNESLCWNILQDLEQRELWKIHVAFSVTAHPSDSPYEILAKIRTLQAQQSPLLQINTVKIYIDGVIDNGSAYLSAPYENSDNCGSPIWDDESLRAFCTFFDQENVQIHSHVIGDAAAAQIVNALAYAMEKNHHLHNENRHVLAHVQLADEATIKRAGSLSLICALQPFWFAQDEPYSIDTALLGTRAETEYPCASLLQNGALLTFGSDNPVTANLSPFIGISCAMHRALSSERLTFPQAFQAYTSNSARQLLCETEHGTLLPGNQADFLLLRLPQNESLETAFTNATVVRTYIGGTCVYENKRKDQSL